MTAKFTGLIILSYLLGSVPFGLIIAGMKGKDLRAIGSGNIGATNVARALGRKWAYLCFALDVLKGFLPMLAARFLISSQPSISELFLWLGCGCAAVAGHLFPVYIGFKGGKGVATGFGMLLGLWPYYTVAGLVTFAVWGVCVLIWRYISLASMIAAVVFPVVLATAIAVLAEWQLANLWPLMIIAAILPPLVIFKHRENIKRLLAGTEYKVMQK